VQFHQYQVVGRGLPTPTDEHPKIYRMKLWATNEVRAKSKFWYELDSIQNAQHASFCLYVASRLRFCDWIWHFWLCRYFLRKLKKVKKSNGQILAINEVSFAIH
jgi:large subunit ribosomal protein L18Ae